MKVAIIDRMTIHMIVNASSLHKAIAAMEMTANSFTQTRKPIGVHQEAEEAGEEVVVISVAGVVAGVWAEAAATSVAAVAAMAVAVTIALSTVSLMIGPAIAAQTSLTLGEGINHQHSRVRPSFGVLSPFFN